MGPGLYIGAALTTTIGRGCSLKIGAIFPQTEISPDPAEIKDFAQAVEGMGYDHIFIADHVLGADPRHHRHPSLQTYSHESVVHEIMTTMGYLAAVTKTVGLASGILILPQRQTALVAKQAAEVDVLSGGRLRLGIGVGWNDVEYQALAQDFQNRGRRSEEQIALMRALWTKEVVNFEGRWHRVSNAGINPLPVQRPIPVWLGGGTQGAGPVLRRVAAIADGWCPGFGPDAAGQALVQRVRDYMTKAGRDPADLELEGRIWTAAKQPEDWLGEARQWQELGATHLVVETRKGGLESMDGRLSVIQQFKEVVATLAD